MTYDLYSSISIHKVLHIIYSFRYCIALSIVHVTKRELSSFLSCQALHFVIVYLVIWKGLIIVTVILVIAAIEGMCIFLLHWFAIHVQSWQN